VTDEPTDEESGAPLSSNRRARPASRPSLGWKLAIVGLALLLVARIVLALRPAATSPGDIDLSNLFTVVIVLASIAAAIFIPLRIGVARSVVQVEGVRRTNPGALVIPANRPQDGRHGLYFIEGSPPLHIFYTWAVTATELQIWQGGRVPSLVATIPWASVQGVETTNHSQGSRYPRMFPAIRLDLPSRYGVETSLEFFIRRPRRPMYPAPLADVNDVADRLSAYLPNRPDAPRA
jgi:hypothetical protein